MEHNFNIKYISKLDILLLNIAILFVIFNDK